MVDILTPEIVLRAYQIGYFPMAEPDTGEIFWYSPDPRAIVPLHAVNVSRSLRKAIRSNRFDIRVDTSFEQVIRGCAQREDSWISEDIIGVYCDLNRLGFAHSVESFHGSTLAGGLYGVAIGGAFFGESMFSLVSDASKVAFVYLTRRLLDRGYSLLDSQFINPHMKSLGAVEIPRARYLRLLEKSQNLECRFV